MTTSSTLSQTKFRKDYTSPDFTISRVEMVIELESKQTKVRSVLNVQRLGDHGNDLVLDGVALNLIRIKIDDVELNEQEFKLGSENLAIITSKNDFVLEIDTEIDPINNTSLEGLYMSDGAFCTQCEAEGFRKITYFLDRPDVLATYTVTLIADKTGFPYLLSNGNKIDQGEHRNNKHWVTWHDPFPKPSYLFAVVAGDFDLLEDKFLTRSGRNVLLQVFVDKGNLNKAEHAMDSLKRSMKWDEQRFNLEYDLDIYMIVAVDFFNMGAMENKGLNVFNSKYVLADEESATDVDYFNIESVIGHEYFHNWTGNRVTCRDWFQLSLKEGLTVFRDQEFSADLHERSVCRINDVRMIRDRQFAEDSGPMSHPIRPDSVVEMNNFYTVTVYNKGAEVIRMMHTILGEENFQKGMGLYFERHDGQAVTCDDFVSAMQDASGVDLSQFKLWYGQSGTPHVSVAEEFDEKLGRYTLTLSQYTPSTADQKEKQLLDIPVDLEFLLENDEQDQGYIIDDHGVFRLTTSSDRIVIEGVKRKPIPVLFRGFSAPVKVDFDQSADELLAILKYSKDEFSIWDASQKLITGQVKQLMSGAQHSCSTVVDALLTVAQNQELSKGIKAEVLSIPSIQSLGECFDIIHVDALSQARFAFVKDLANRGQSVLLDIYRENNRVDTDLAPSIVWATRDLKRACLAILSFTGDKDVEELIRIQYESSSNMTDTLSSLQAAKNQFTNLFEELMKHFESKWHDNGLVMDKWFALQATREDIDVIGKLEELSHHEAFSWDNPNRVRSLVGSFVMNNYPKFHHSDGKGYQFLTEVLVMLDKKNPQLSSALVTPFLMWKRFDIKQQTQIKIQLQELKDTQGLSKDLSEKVEKSLMIDA